MSEVLYRKWRPQSFAEVAGQEAVTRTLRNSVASGRLAHAYLLCGPRGTGKTSLGRLLAKAVNCAAPTDGEPCNRCDSCAAFNGGRAIDFIEQDAASHNSVDDIRQLRENVVLTPMAGRRKVYLLDEVHMLSKGAYNALLKTLEEPPPHIIFVLATTEAHRVEPTIISRCQRFDLRRIPLAAVVDRLAYICEKEGYTLDRRSLEEIARSATGSLRDAINGVEQVVTYYGVAPSLEQVQEALGLTVDARAGELARLALAGDLAGGLKLIVAVRDDGVEMRHFCKQVVVYLRGLLLAKAGASEALDMPADVAAEVKAEGARMDRGELVRALRVFGRVDREFRDDPQSSLPLEMAYIDFVSGTAGEAAGVPGARPVRTVPAMPREPEFSIPAAETEDVASTVTRATLGPVVEPEAVPAAGVDAEPAAAGDSPGSVDLLERVWRMAKETDRQLAGLLNGSCEVTALGEDSVTLGFYHTFHLERVESGANTQRLAELFGRALGHKVTLVLQHAPRSDRPQKAVKGGHLVQAARELGARPVGESESS